jgi:ribosomal protein S27AE
MATPGTGEDIEDTCSRCGDVWHVVMAKVGERIARVVCKRCGSQHAYRSGTSTSAESGGGAAGKKGLTMRRKTTKSTVAEPIAAPTFDPSKPPRAYSPRDAYLPSERIVHPTFGTGVVAATPGPGKVDVVFPTGVRTLACAKTESTLERPTTVSNAPIGDRPPSPK